MILQNRSLRNLESSARDGTNTDTRSAGGVDVAGPCR